MTGRIVSLDAGDADLETVGGKGAPKRLVDFMLLPCPNGRVRLWNPAREAT